MVADFFTEILTGATEMIGALATVLVDALALFYDAGAVQPLGQLVLTIAGIGLGWTVVNFVLNFIKGIGSRASRSK
jgi:hypothetical protein